MPGQGSEKILSQSEAKNQCRLCGNFRLFTLDVFHSFVKLADSGSGVDDPLASKSVPLLRLINDYLNIDVKKNANLPVHICKKCCNQLMSWYSFKSTCLNQQIKFNGKYAISDSEENNKSALCNEIKFENAGIEIKFKNSGSKAGDISGEKEENVGYLVKTASVKKINERLELSETIKEKGYFKESTAEKGCASTSAYNKSGLLPNASNRKISSNIIKVKVKVSKSKKKNIVKDENIFQCNECAKIFHSKFSIRKHLKTHESREYCCHLCGMLFKAASTLRYHLHLHSGRKKFSCPHCSKEFHQTNHLNQHIRIHTGERPYSCSECEQKFTRSCQLMRHVMAVHRKEHKYKCDLCGKGFLSNSNFKAHLMRHGKQRNVKCDVCGKSFVTRNELFRHQRTHTGDKPFPCPECGLRFADCSNRKKHMINCHSLTVPNGTIVNTSGVSKNKGTTELTKVKSEDAHRQKNRDAIKSFVKPHIVLLSPVNLKTNIASLFKPPENLIDGSDLSYNKNNVYLDLNNLQIISQGESKNDENHSEVLIQNNNALTDQERFEESHVYVANVTGNADVPGDFTVSEIVQDTEQLEIPFCSDIPIINSLADCATQSIAYIIHEKEIFTQTDVITQNVTLDIESSYLGLVGSQRKSSVDELTNVGPCETQSVIKVLNNEDTVLLFSE